LSIAKSFAELKPQGKLFCRKGKKVCNRLPYQIEYREERGNLLVFQEVTMTAIDPRVEAMSVKDIISALVTIHGGNRTNAAKALGISRQRMDYLAEDSSTRDEFFRALETARKNLRMSKSAMWDILIGAKKSAPQ
jgi:hypothetical protein